MNILKTENNKPIAFFDSGVGGLTVLAKLRKLLPHEDFLYFGDTKNMPYGEKTDSELIKFADKIFKFFEEKDVKAVVMACNTTSAASYEALKDNYSFRIYPIIQTCASYIAGLAVERVGVFATDSTVKSGAYAREIAKYNSETQVASIACPEWVKIVEENRENDPSSADVVKFYLAEMMEFRPEKIVLGCTHYPYLLDLMSQFVPREVFIDPSEYFAQYIKTDLGSRNLLSDAVRTATDKFFVSADSKGFQLASSMFYPVDELPELALFEPRS